MWRLDLLEVKFFNTSPRFNKTKTLLNSKKNDKLLKKLPSSKEEAEKEILLLKSEAFQNKYHGSFKNLHKEVKKIIKSDIHKHSKDNKQSLVEFLKNDDIIDDLITSKLVKIIQQIILVNADLKKSPPLYISEDLRAILTDKSHKSHPSKFFIDHCQNNKVINSYVSSLWNQKAIKSSLAQAEWSLKLVRGVSKLEKDERRKQLGKKVDDADDEDDEDDDKDDDKDEDSEELMVYEDSDEEVETAKLDPNVNYNEITDEEPSDDESTYPEPTKQPKSKSKKDDFFDSDDDMESKYNLPQLTTGYYSGGSDDEEFDADNDKVVKQVTTQRKNRRGQRARQKIWEKKFGKKAKHKEKEIAAIQDDRKRRQLEFEERERKRQAKAQPTGANNQPLGERKPPSVGTPVGSTTGSTGSTTGSSTVQSFAPKEPLGEEHPSWKAKKMAEEKLKNVKFQGKKITFD
ncbi:bud site selection protein 22 [[Candida] jaroonii]|uniref:Bud site selection protein 22 n=1 Tax=[Candida] jaroonii TaxID=467808 RepID=A0ACA9Y4J3_9ASCO|nr:bud site selection protein 22 [[Candida] jaroonii]